MAIGPDINRPLPIRAALGVRAPRAPWTVGYRPTGAPMSVGGVRGTPTDLQYPPDVQRAGLPADIQRPGGPADLQRAGGLGGAGGAGGSGAGQERSPLDSTYYANMAANQFKVNNELNALNQAGAYANTGYQNQLGTLAYQQPRQQLAQMQAANSRGGLYSTVYGQQQGSLATQFADRLAALGLNFQRGAAGRQSQMSALLGGIPLYQAQQYANAVLRASALAQKNPATGMSGAPLTRGRGGGAGGGGGARGRLARALADRLSGPAGATVIPQADRQVLR